MDYESVVEQTENLLTIHFGYPVQLDTITPIQTKGRFLIVRCQVNAPSATAPTSVIIKQMHTDLTDAKRMEVDQTGRNEAAVLQTLPDSTGSTKYAPRYYTGDHTQGLQVLEDLGDYPSLQDVLYEQDFHRAKDALTQYGYYLATMQLAARDRVDIYFSHSERLGSLMRRDVQGWDLRDYLPKLRPCLQVFQIEIDGGFTEEIADLAQSLQAPGPFYTVSHCDAGPHNIMVLPNQSILIDFEYACFQHGFVDLIQARMAFPSAGFGRRSPQHIIAQMEQVYRNEWAQVVPEIMNDQVFERALLEAGAHIVMTTLLEYGQSGLTQLLTSIQPTDTPDFMTQRLLTFLKAYLEIPNAFDQLPKIRAVVRQIYDTISVHRPEVEPLAYFPAFQADSSHQTGGK
ncbi:MAG: aminoglycoside phosphotransferase family protein [Chloroflexota bacterium]